MTRATHNERTFLDTLLGIAEFGRPEGYLGRAACTCPIGETGACPTCNAFSSIRDEGPGRREHASIAQAERERRALMLLRRELGIRRKAPWERRS